MKSKLYQIILGSIMVISLFSCQSEEEASLPDIKVGTDAESIKEISLNRLTDRNILLSGGNRKFAVNVENSKMVQAVISYDTLKIKGLFEGETFATIISHDKVARLDIKVESPKLGLSQDFIQLRPSKEINKSISLSGGGEVVLIEEKDPDDILEAKWNGKTNLLEILARYEGEAEITISSDGFDTKTLKVKVKPDGEDKRVGFYGTTNRNLINYLLPIMTAKRDNTMFFANNMLPFNQKGLYNELSQWVRISLSKTDLKQGERVDVNLQFSSNNKSGISSGKYNLYVDEIRTNEIVLLGRGFKFVLPKE